MSFLEIKNFDIKNFTTIKIGGIVEKALLPSNKEGILEVFDIIKKSGKNFFILGGGSNVVIKDDLTGFYAIITSKLDYYKIEDNTIICGAGLKTSLFCEISLDNSLSGSEFLYGLPGSIGGAVFMNARSYGFSISDIIESVDVYDYENNSFLSLKSSECEFGYKNSIFQKRPYFISEIKFKLTKGNFNEIKEKMNNFKKDREEKGQYIFPSAGCAFKNNYDIGIPTGKIIDELGLKGMVFGGVKVYEKHANFLVNTGNATYEDYINAVSYIKRAVKNERGIDLECEVIFLP